MEKYCDDWNLSNIHEVIKTVLNFLFIYFLEKYFTHIKSIKTLNKQLLLRCFLYAQKSRKHIKNIKTSSIVNEDIRGNFTSAKRIKSTKTIKRIKSTKTIKSIKSTKRIESIKSTKRIKSIKTLNKWLSFGCFLYA